MKKNLILITFKFRKILLPILILVFTNNISAQTSIYGEPLTNVNINLPNTVVESNTDYVLVGYTDEKSIAKPYFTLRDHSGTIISQYELDISQNAQPTYLMDISPIINNQTVYATGMYYNVLLQKFDGFVLEFDITSGTILQQQTFEVEPQISGAMIPYSVEYDSKNKNVILVGEKKCELFTNPSYISNLPASSLSNTGGNKTIPFIICLTSSNLSNNLWTRVSFEDSKYENITITPYGYFISGSSNHSKCEAILIDNIGNTVWQHTFCPTNATSNGASGYYSTKFDKIFYLFQSSSMHTFGLIAFDPLTGTVSTSSKLFQTPNNIGQSEIYGCKISTDYSAIGNQEEQLLIGGYLAPLGIWGASGQYYPFYAKISYDNLLGFTPSDINFFNEYQTMNFTSYFGNWVNTMPNSFDMISDNNNTSNKLYLVSKSNINNSINLNTAVVNNIISQTNNCLFSYPLVSNTFSFSTLLNIKIVQGNIIFSTPTTASNLISNQDLLLCDAPAQKTIQSVSNKFPDTIFRNNEQIDVYNILGEKIYTGNYADFKIKTKSCNTFINTTLILKSKETFKSYKINTLNF